MYLSNARFCWELTALARQNSLGFLEIVTQHTPKAYEDRPNQATISGLESDKPHAAVYRGAILCFEFLGFQGLGH